MDEAFFVYDVVSGRKYWSPRGERIVVPYTRNHRRIAVYGAIAKNGRQLYRTRELFDAPTFVWYLKELQRHFGKMAAVMESIPAPDKSRQKAAAGEQKHQDYLPFEKIPVPQRG